MNNELVSHRNNHAHEIAEYITSAERMLDLTQRRDYFSQMDDNDFIDFIQTSASLVRTGDSTQHQAFDGSTVSLMFHEVPDQREKEQLIRETWTVAKGFLANSELSDQDALDYAAVTVAGGILYAHPFADGNGRTSRITSYIMARDKYDESEVHDILAKQNGGGSWQVAPMAILTPGKAEFHGPQPTLIEWEDAMAGEAEDVLGGAIANSMRSNQVIRQFIEDHGDKVSKQLADSTHQNQNGESVLEAEKFMSELVNDPNGGIVNANELLRIYRGVRADYVHRFLLAMQSDTLMQLTRTLQVGMRDGVSNSEFFVRLRKTTEAEVGKRAIGGMLTAADQQLIQHRAYSKVRQLSH